MYCCMNKWIVELSKYVDNSYSIEQTPFQCLKTSN